MTTTTPETATDPAGDDAATFDRRRVLLTSAVRIGRVAALYGELDTGVGEHPPRAGGPGVVPGLDQLAVDVDAVGVRPPDVPAVDDAGRVLIRWEDAS